MAILTVLTRLLDHTLEGPRIIDMGTTKTCQCFVLPRDGMIDVSKVDPTIKQYAFYILLGEEKTGKPMAYFGQTNDFTTRVIDHKLKKAFWKTALVFVSKINDIFASEVLYLEYLGWRKGTDANNYKIENEKAILEPSLSTYKKIDMDLFFEEIMFLTRFYGCDVFDSPKAKPIALTKGEEFYSRIPKNGIDATIMYYPDSKTFILKKGSIIAYADAPSCPPAAKKLREEIRKNSTFSKKNGDTLLILSDIDITSEKRMPSHPASVIAGTSRQGTTAFVDKNGKRFGERYPK